MSDTQLGFLIWIFVGFLGFAVPFPKALLIAALLLLSFVIAGVTVAVRWLLDFVSVVAQGAGEVFLSILKDVTFWLCRALPPGWQSAWVGRSERVMGWAETRRKSVWEERKPDGDPGAAAGDKKQAEEKLSAYQWALKVMGLENEPDLTLPTLKQRYRQMMSVVHPDKQFPNQVFAQQINDAVETIKRARGWA